MKYSSIICDSFKFFVEQYVLENGNNALCVGVSESECNNCTLLICNILGLFTVKCLLSLNTYVPESISFNFRYGNKSLLGKCI